MTLLSSKTFPQTGFIFPQLQLQAPKGILPLPVVQRRRRGRKKKYPRTGVSCGQKKPPLPYQNWSPEARVFAKTGHSDSWSTGPGPSDWRLLTRWPLLAGCRLRPALPAAGRARAPRVLPPLAAALFRAAAERPPQARRRCSERVGRSPSARSLGSLVPSGKAGGDAGLHSPAFEPTLTKAPATGRSRKNGQTRRLKRKTRAAGCKSSPASLAKPTPGAAPAAERAPVPGHPGSSGPD